MCVYMYVCNMQDFMYVCTYVHVCVIYANVCMYYVCVYVCM